jgi:hypothetical protein
VADELIDTPHRRHFPDSVPNTRPGNDPASIVAAIGQAFI